MLPAWTWLIGFGLGAVVGSFLNVVIYRLPRSIALSRPHFSYCPSSGERLTVLELVPILSYIALRGRSRHDGSKIPIRYLIVELITGALWAGIWYRWFIDPQQIGVVDVAEAAALALFVSALVAAIYIDLAFYIIPDQINAFMLFVGLALNAARLWAQEPEAWAWSMPSALAGWIAGVGVFWFIALLGRVLFGKDAMGHGDIKMARGIGAVLLPVMALYSFGIAIVLGAVIGVIHILIRGKQAEPEEDPDEEEYGPEPVGSILKCGLGYMLAIDVVGLFYTPLYESWFGENPYSVEDLEEEPVIGATMIPFGPYLAAGAIIVALFAPELQPLFDAYWSRVGGA